MYVYAGIDEAGYGPMFGPLLVGCMVLGIRDYPPAAAEPAAASTPAPIPAPTPAPGPACGFEPPPLLWQRLAKAVCKDITGRRGRIPVNDSKKLHGRGASAARAAATATTLAPVPAPSNPACGFAPSAPTCDLASSSAPPAFTPSSLRYLELGVLAFAALAGHRPQAVDQWLDCLGDTRHRDPRMPRWYQPAAERPWAALPCAWTEGELAVARSLLASTAGHAGVEVLDLGAAVVFENQFNQMVGQTRSKAAASFTFVARHLRRIWDHHAADHPHVAVDRQSGRTHYRELLALTFPEATLRILDETPDRSAYLLVAPPSTACGFASSVPHSPPSSRSMTVSFEVEAEAAHLPVALASMISKYTRELLMHRFQAWFARHAPPIRPTAGYALDAQRFWQEIQPFLPALEIAPEELRRQC